MFITNKLESIRKINELGLNRFQEQLFTENDTEKVKEFLSKYPAKYYAIRDKSKSGGIFKLKIAYENVLNEIKGYSLFTINVSSANYAENQLLVGEIEVLSDGRIYTTLSTNPTYSVRDALKNPSFNFSTDIFDKKLNQIPYFDMVYKYIIDYRLQDVIVEFSLFDKEVGIKNQNIVIYELRTHY